jgi:DHA3 family macrolide efflux protein-like MFS transporter
LAGALVDRWNRRWTMILSKIGMAICVLAIALLVIADSLEIWHIYLVAAISSIFNAFQWPAYTATITLLVPKQHLGRAGGMTKIGESVAQLISPVLSGVLLMIIQLQGIILLDVATFIFATVTLLLVRFPHVKTTIAEAKKSLLLREAVYGWHYIKARSGLLGLLILLAINHFLMQTAGALFTPFMLSFTSVTILGTILSIGGFGMLMGSLVMSIWGGPQRLIYGVFGFQLLGGICCLVIGLHTIVPLLAVLIFLLFFSFPIIYGCDQALWQRKVPAGVQGRVFAMKRMIDWSAIALAYLIAGPLADYVFEPLMAPNGYLAGSIGQLIGVGPGRGIGLLFIIMGTLTLLATVIAYQYPRLRQVVDDLPDAIADVQDSPKNQS